MTRQIDHTKRRQAGAGKVALQFDALGNPLCRNCQQPVPPGKKTFCTDQCVHDWKMTTSPTYVRGLVFKRDKGICCQCGWDAESAHKIYIDLWHGHCVDNRGAIGDGIVYQTVSEELKNWHSMLTKRGLKLPDLSFPSGGLLAHEWINKWGHGKARILSFWENDHILAVKDGGGISDLNNMRTLCKSPCHANNTLKQRRARENGQS